MLLKDLPEDEDSCWRTAWTWASKVPVSLPTTRAVLITEQLINLRMQNFVRDWANEGYEPAQRAWARRIAARLK